MEHCLTKKIITKSLIRLSSLKDYREEDFQDGAHISQS